MAAMLKSLRFIPFCVLILSGYAFADDYGDSDSEKGVFPEARLSDIDISPYVRVVFDTIKNQMVSSLEFYHGKACTIKLGLSRDGTILYAVDDGGEPDFCNAVILAIRSVKKFPPPPSERIYQSIRDCTLDFKV
ncbi:TonB C-terminal domain-containing protein [Salmonella enterica]|nr:TonB C-terminal domain-containing protein [Salmonella enterica]